MQRTCLLLLLVCAISLSTSCTSEPHTQVVGNDPGGSSGIGSSGATSQGGDAGAFGEPGSRVVCTTPTSEAAQPELLSQTGCINMNDPSQPAPGLVPYAVNSALWSDGAEKQRFARVPDGKSIHVKDCSSEPETCVSIDEGGSAKDEGHWEFPVGTVLVKNFSLGSVLVETRLMMRMDELSWLGVSYEWNEAQTDATLLFDTKSKQVGKHSWRFPARAECFQCHTKGAGISLGPSTAQLEREFAYADGAMNQIDKFVSLGLLTSRPKSVPPYPTPTKPGDLELRARSYLHANCSNCHRPGGTVGDVDLRFTTSFKDMGLCNQNIQRGTGDPSLPQKRLVPGDPVASSLSFRVHDLGVYRMPKIGSSVVDLEGAELLDNWIRSIESCP